MGWEVGGTSQVMARWEHGQFSHLPAGGALSPELPALGLWGFRMWPGGWWESRCLDLRFVTWGCVLLPSGEMGSRHMGEDKVAPSAQSF